jgi:hypothetical protein
VITLFQRFGRAKPKSPWNSREPIREELFSVERLEEHARSLAIAQPVASGASRGSPLAARLANNAAALLEAHRKIAKAIDEGRTITPAAEWLTDNYHLVESRFVKFVRIYRRAITDNSQSLPVGPLPDIRASSASRGLSWHMLTVALTLRCYVGTCAPIKKFSR